MKQFTILMCLCFGLSKGTFAQDSTKKKIKELHMGVTDISPLSLFFSFKKQIKKQIFYKIGAVNLSANYSTYSASDPLHFPSNNLGYSYGAMTGLEFRKTLSEKLTFFHGPSINYWRRYEETRVLDPAIPADQQAYKSVSESYGGNYSIGLLLGIGKGFLIGIDLAAGIFHSTNTSMPSGPDPKITTNRSSYFNFNNRGGITLVYRF